MFSRRVLLSTPYSTAFRSFARKAKSADTYEFTVAPYKAHKCDTPSESVSATKDELLGAYKTMYAVRRMEQAADKMYKARKIQGFLHLYNGQEAVVTGIESAITPKDHIITAYRDHAFAYTRGCSVQSILAELMGKKAGVSKGKGGSMHMYSKEGRFYGGNGIVGAQTPIGAGIAFAQKYNQTGEICVACYGDGSANQGQLFEAFNMSYLWKLPVIYVCENNKYGMGTAVSRASSSDQFYTRGDVVPGIQVDGMDYLSVRNATEYAKEYALTKGPIILEMITYRYVGHSMSDPGTTYRTREEVELQRTTRDPIERVRKLLTENSMVADEDLRVIEKEIRASVEKDVSTLDALEFPELSDTFKHVYVEDVPIRGVEFSDSYHP